MPIQIGATPHNFSDPTALLSDCHRRIEMFLRTLEKASLQMEQPIANETRAALESALRYFRDAAPKHTADEEESVFPRLRQSRNPDVIAALAALDALEQDHRRANELHARVDQLGRRCLEHGYLSAGDAADFRQMVAALGSIYEQHIRMEDDAVFPMAERALSQQDKAEIAAEMSARRAR